MPSRLLLLLALLLTPVTASATVVRPMNIEELAAQATSVVHGVVEAQHAVRIDGRFVTLVDVRVEERLESDAATDPGRVTVEIPGGTVGQYSQVVAGAPRFAVGQEVVLFLWAASPGAAPRVLGLSLGAFTVERSAAGPVAVSRRGSLTAATAAGVEHLGDLRVPLKELLGRVRSVVPASRRGQEGGR